MEQTRRMKTLQKFRPRMRSVRNVVHTCCVRGKSRNKWRRRGGGGDGPNIRRKEGGGGGGKQQSHKSQLKLSGSFIFSTNLSPRPHLPPLSSRVAGKKNLPASPGSPRAFSCYSKKMKFCLAERKNSFTPAHCYVCSRKSISRG